MKATFFLSLMATLTLTYASHIPTGSSCGAAPGAPSRIPSSPPVASPPEAFLPVRPPPQLVGDLELTATLLFNIDGNEALANFQIPVPGTRTVNKSMIGLAVNNVKGLQAGQDASEVACQAWDAEGNAIGEQFDEMQVELDGGVQVLVGSVSCFRDEWRVSRWGVGVRLPADRFHT